MATLADTVDFEVKWFPFQLNPNAPEAGQNKVAMYMQKFGRSKQDTMRMATSMKSNFTNVGLPFKFTEKALTGNTFNAHRLLVLSHLRGGAEAQDAVAEELFLNYFGEEKFLNDPEVLRAAGRKGGLSEEDLTRLVDDRNFMTDETLEELAVGKAMRVTGVPHFSMSLKGASSSHRPMTISGAQDPTAFQQAIAQLLAEDKRTML